MFFTCYLIINCTEKHQNAPRKKEENYKNEITEAEIALGHPPDVYRIHSLAFQDSVRVHGTLLSLNLYNSMQGGSI